MPSCMLCNSSHANPIVREGRWQYFRCERCGLVFLHPQPTNDFLRTHYQSYLPSSAAEIESWRHLMQHVFERMGDSIESRHPMPGTILDLGCGYGFFLDHMSRRGWKVEGVEISIRASRYARESLGVSVTSHPLPRSDWEDERYDVISLFYVIEHLANPLEVLKEAMRLLRPGGWLLLRWPHSTPIAMLLRPWLSQLRLYQAPSHLFDFSPKTMFDMLNHIGYEEIHTTISGWTRPREPWARLASAISGILGEVLARCSRNHWLLPGVSKTTFARKPIE
jgi:2-polyprenyl-3-methyl-5-hydroxy-6-metoxy-1,4-benzoquinol methylase